MDDEELIRNFYASDAHKIAYDKRLDRQLLIGHGERCTANEAMAVYSDDDRRFYVVKKKESHAQVRYSMLLDKERTAFDAGRSRRSRACSRRTQLSS